MLNRTITLRDTIKAALDAEAGAVKLTGGEATRTRNPKAQSRPKGKSPAEYRAEARARDPQLAAAHAAIAALPGITADAADLLSGDLATATAFRRGRDQRPGRPRGEVDDQRAAPRRSAIARSTRSTSPSSPRCSRRSTMGPSPPRLPRPCSASWSGPAGRSASCETSVAAPAVDLGAAVDAVIAANPEKAAQYRAGKTGLLGFFVGQVMKATPNADAAAVNQALRQRLA